MRVMRMGRGTGMLLFLVIVECQRGVIPIKHSSFLNSASLSQWFRNDNSLQYKEDKPSPIHKCLSLEVLLPAVCDVSIYDAYLYRLSMPI